MATYFSIRTGSPSDARFILSFSFATPIRLRMHTNVRGVASPASTSCRPSSSSASLMTARSSRRCSVTVRAADANCRDMVGQRREVDGKGKVYKLKFLAADGEFREADCPDNMYIFDAAEKAGIDLPATCRGGRETRMQASGRSAEQHGHGHSILTWLATFPCCRPYLWCLRSSRPSAHLSYSYSAYPC